MKYTFDETVELANEMIKDTERSYLKEQIQDVRKSKKVVKEQEQIIKDNNFTLKRFMQYMLVSAKEFAGTQEMLAKIKENMKQFALMLDSNAVHKLTDPTRNELKNRYKELSSTYKELLDCAESFDLQLQSFKNSFAEKVHANNGAI